MHLRKDFYIQFKVKHVFTDILKKANVQLFWMRDFAKFENAEL